MASSLLPALPALAALARGDIFFVTEDPGGAPTDKKINIETLFGNLPKLDNIVLQSEVDSVTFLQVLDNDGGVPVLNVDTLNERVGIGTAVPFRQLDIEGLTAVGGGHMALITGTSGTGETLGTISFGNATDNALSRVRARADGANDSGKLELMTKNLGGGFIVRLIINSDGNVGIGSITSPSAGSGKVLYVGDNAGDPTMAANTAGFYGKDVAGTVEAFAIDEAGNAAQLTSHPEDAPPQYYRGVTEDEIPSFIRKSFNLYIGKIEWFRSDIPLRSYETFAAYNTRHGFTARDPGFLVQYDWTEQQQIRVNRSEAVHEAWFSGDQTDPEPEIYIAQEPPQSLQDRGIILEN